MAALTTKAQASGLATLGSDGIVPDAQLPVGVRDFQQAAAVADQGALTASAPAALTAVVAAGANPTKAEFDALLADVTALRTNQAAIVVDLAAARTKLNALLASLRTSELLDT